MDEAGGALMDSNEAPPDPGAGGAGGDNPTGGTDQGK
jgi:hypothetical protein